MALRIKLVKSVHGRKPNHITTLRSLGLTKINQIVEKEATPDILGKIHIVSYLVQVEEV
jgi:large subunit ribosomal protein L30